MFGYLFEKRIPVVIESPIIPILKDFVCGFLCFESFAASVYSEYGFLGLGGRLLCFVVFTISATSGGERLIASLSLGLPDSGVHAEEIAAHIRTRVIVDLILGQPIKH